jgi:uncharacterized protein
MTLTTEPLVAVDRLWAREVGMFLLVAFGFSWTIWVAVLLVNPEAGSAAVMAGAFGPAVAAAGMVRRSGRPIADWLRSIFQVRVPGRLYAVALVIPIGIVGVQTAAAVLLDVPVTFDDLPARVLTFLVTAVVVFFVGGGQEEPGWRGWLQPKLQERLGPLPTSVVIGVVWAFWHLPLFVLDFEMYSEFRFWLYVPTLVALSVIYTHLWHRSRGSVVVAMTLHAAINASSALIPVEDTVETVLDLPFLAQLSMAGVAAAIAATLVLGRGLTNDTRRQP